MTIQSATPQSVLQSVCDAIDPLRRQTCDAIVRQSKRQLQQNRDQDFDGKVLAVCAVAASLLSGDDCTVIFDQLECLDDWGSSALANRIAGYASLAEGDFTSAAKYFCDSVRLDPHQSDCWNLLGQIAEQDDDIDGAIRYYDRGAFFDDDSYRSVLALVRIYKARKNLGDAIHVCRVALIRDARSAVLNRTLAKLLEKRARNLMRRMRYRTAKRLRLEALACYKVVNAREPERKILMAQGRLQHMMDRHDEARETYQKAVELDPKSPVTLSHLASANVDFGEITTALKQYEMAIELDPNRADTHFRYCRARKFRQGADVRKYIANLQELIRQAKPEGQRQISLNFALAKVFEDLGDFPQAWEHYKRANEVKARRQQAKSRARGQNMDAERSMEAVVDQAMDFFSAETFRRLSYLGNDTQKPIFIVGMPRSGTTLTEQIISSHPEAAGAGELNHISQIRFQLSHVRPERSADGLRSQQDHYPSNLPSLEPAFVRQLGREYIDELATFDAAATRVTDKMPTNFWHLGLIALLFPNATVVHCQRHPMDVMVSCYCQNLNPPFCDFDQMLDYHRSYRRMMRHWEQVLPIKIYNSSYEALVENPEPMSRQLIQHCGLQWSDACLDFHHNTKAAHTPSKWQVRQPMYQSSVEKWRKFEEQLEAVAERVHLELADESNHGTLGSATAY
ncbi:sulfotransferase [Stieleria sp. JC731]|uniref:tetratricopeptide repeat-containing sulfotransferase family protein n=1 Tax=Pirellulaceae TaxID=2691357 RepID=UPI001E46B791|nr:sulfotransferase [Stieleria sp. JC731]MCC9600166.1 sulfotransferase [Stieleria sp. JC731]